MLDALVSDYSSAVIVSFISLNLFTHKSGLFCSFFMQYNCRKLIKCTLNVCECGCLRRHLFTPNSLTLIAANCENTTTTNVVEPFTTGNTKLF